MHESLQVDTENLHIDLMLITEKSEGRLPSTSAAQAKKGDVLMGKIVKGTGEYLACHPIHPLRALHGGPAFPGQ